MMEKLKVLDLFSGIGGFSLGLERTGGFETVAFCEIEEFPRKVLAKHWPEVPIYEDVRKLTAETLRRDGIAVDVITGGFPCQDISVAGKQAGIGEGTRSGLWSECKRLLGELRPRYAIFENVANLLSGPSERPGGWFSRILCDLAEIGYDAEWHDISASAVGLHHKRHRIWIIAHAAKLFSNGLKDHAKKGKRQICKFGSDNCASNAPDASGVRPQGQGRAFNSMYSAPYFKGEINRAINDSRRAIEPDLGRVANGVPNGSHRLKALGNAVVPQIPELIGHAILEAERKAA